MPWKLETDGDIEKVTDEIIWKGDQKESTYQGGSMVRRKASFDIATSKRGCTVRHEGASPFYDEGI